MHGGAFDQSWPYGHWEMAKASAAHEDLVQDVVLKSAGLRERPISLWCGGTAGAPASSTSVG